MGLVKFLLSLLGIVSFLSFAHPAKAVSTVFDSGQYDTAEKVLKLKKQNPKEFQAYAKAARNLYRSLCLVDLVDRKIDFDIAQGRISDQGNVLDPKFNVCQFTSK